MHTFEREPSESLRAELRANHEHLERLLDELSAAAETLDDKSIRDTWDAVERTLLGHLEWEERELLPLYESVAPGEVAQIRAEHCAFRSRLEELGVMLDCSALRVEAVHEFLADLRHHAQREDVSLYLWTTTGLAAQRRADLVASLRERASGWLASKAAPIVDERTPPVE